MRLIRLIASGSRATLLLAVLAGVVGGAASTSLLFVINRGLSHNGSIPMNLVLAFLGLAALAMITRASSALILARIGADALFGLRIGLSRQILRVPLRRLEDVGAARLLGILTDDVLNITNAVASLPLLCVNIAGLLTCLVLLAWLSWVLFLAVIVLLCLGIVTYQLPFFAATKHFTSARKEHNNILNGLRALIGGIKELKVNRDRRKAFVSEMLEGSSIRFQKHSMSAMKIYVLGATWGEMLSFITIGLLVFVAPHLTHVTAVTLTAFVLVLIYLMEPVEFIMHQLPQISKAIVALKSVEEMGLSLAHAGAEEELEAPLLSKPSWERLDLVEMGFSYERDDGLGKFVLGPIDLSFAPGEVVFFTGGNGSGKTTLAKLLIGLYPPHKGKILLDREPVTDQTRDNYRQYFAVVFSDFYLFETLLGIDKTNLDERAAAYIKHLQLSNKVKITNGALSTVDLSQGQRKRLALLTAYLEDRPIFLFDEWAADQDTMFKEIFYYQLLPELKARGKAVFVISHDERYYSMADRVIKLDNGQLVEDRQSHEQVVNEMAV